MLTQSGGHVVRIEVRRNHPQVLDGLYSNPPGWGILDTAQTKHGKGVLQPFWADEAAVGQHTMEAQADPEGAEYVETQ